ncbi:orcokinin peptides type A-like isoform X1 [Temnothorax curvispinosus]|uniref:Orcokinin peptides type A-like isoform X1 n=1 Tax=Temnothorax curvispinosus TaxID=300111 RepID=A0A6J1Q0Q2_9HYME|nr:orcokinin peptides type A-like isoform X1 [Temnothorax curvispinosus]
MALSGSSIVIVFIGVAAYAAAGPVQAGPNTVQQNEYGVLPDSFTRYWEDRSMGNRNINGVGGGHLLRQGRRGLDSLSGATFGESKRFIPFRNLVLKIGSTPTRIEGPAWLRRLSVMNVHPGNFDEIDRSGFDRFSKRNIDEIDTAFDSFFKRNFDEIDRGSWSGFVKRLNNYLADRQRR